MILFVLLFLGILVFFDRFRDTGVLPERLLSQRLFWFVLLGLLYLSLIDRFLLISDRLLILYNGCRSLTFMVRFRRLVHLLTLFRHGAGGNRLSGLRWCYWRDLVLLGVILIVVLLIIFLLSK